MKIFLLASCIVLAGCGSILPKSLNLVSTEQHAILPPISPPPDPDLVPFTFDVPRDASAPLTVRKTTQCLSVAKAQQDQTFWTQCGVHLPLPNSNIYLGFDQSNYFIFIEDMAKLKAREKEWQARLKQINDERAADANADAAPVKTDKPSK